MSDPLNPYPGNLKRFEVTPSDAATFFEQQYEEDVNRAKADLLRYLKAIEAENAALKAAALDVVRRWHSPQWKWDQHTGDLIKRLADAAGIDPSEL